VPARWGAAGAAAVAGAAILAAGAGASGPTWSDGIEALFRERCQGCHRPGDIAPFPLLEHGDAAARARRILRAVERRRMPPWKPVPGFGDFADGRRLDEAEIAMIRAWVAAGAPAGAPVAAPARRPDAEAWRLGRPDDELAPAEAFEVPSADRDLYRCFVIPTRYAEDRYLRAVEFLPGDRRVVHHIITYLDTLGRAERLDQADPGPGYTCFGGPGFLPGQMGIGGWAPGAPPQRVPEGTGLLLPAGAHVVMQVHYHNRSGVVVRDRSRIGLHFARGRVDQRVRAIPVVNRDVLIPAGAARHVVRASWTVPPSWNLHAIAVTPHMHLLGREMTVTATMPDGSTRPLIRIDDWDFHWQGTYNFARPVPLPGGTRIDVEAVYDNSAANPRNPSRPPRDVAWGEGTTDEMCIAFLRITVDRERLGHEPRYVTRD
jgi:mono/diheme cytochrome c family protein